MVEAGGEWRAGVGQEVGEHLDDAPPVGEYQGQARFDVDLQAVPGPGGGEGAPGPFHQRGQLGGFGADRQRACLDAGDVQQVGDQLFHVVGLVVDDPDELARHRRVEVGRRVHDRGGGAFDGGQGRQQLVADRGQEVGPQPFLFLDVGHVLEGDDQRLDCTTLSGDGCCIEQHGDAAPVGDADGDLLGPHRLRGAEQLGDRELSQGDLAPVGAPEGQYVEEVFRGLVWVPQDVDDPAGLPVERAGGSRGGVEDDDADR